MSDAKKDIAKEFEAAVKDYLRGSEQTLAELSVYAAERAAHLTTVVGQPGFAQAAIAERDAVVLKAATLTAKRADELDQRVVGLIHGALIFGAKILAAGLVA